jgi:hypothetical protein
MNLKSKLLLDEMHRLFAESDRKWDAQSADADRKWDTRVVDSEKQIEQRITDFDDSVTKRFSAADDSLAQRFAESDLNWERRITDSEVRQSDLISHIEKRQDARIDSVLQATGDLQSWKQESEGAVDDLKLKMSKLTKYYDRSVFDNPPALSGLPTVISPQVEQTAAASSAEQTAARPNGHDIFTTTRMDGAGEFTFPDHSPANGTHDNTTIPMAIPLGYIPDESNPNPCNPRLPKFNFPTYDGDTTKLWITQAEDYFDMYGVPSYLWVKVAGMHFNGAAKCWIQSLDRPSKIPWTEFCKLLLDRFARDQHETLLRQMFHIQQQSTVTDYVENFPP